MTKVLTALAAAVALAAIVWLCIPGEPPPGIVLLTVDTLRADRLGCYGNDQWGRSPSPVADALAAQGLLFEQCIVPRGQTHPSIASLLLGKYPITHGLRENGQKPAPGQLSLAEVLRGAGYNTAGFAANLNAYTLRSPRRPAWWTRGFETFGDGYGGDPVTALRTVPQNQWLWDERVERQALEWIRGLRTREVRPFFLWVHFYDVHKPFLPHESYPDFYPEYEGPLEMARPGGPAGPASAIDPITPAVDGATLAGESLAPNDHRKVLACYDAAVYGVDARIGRILDALDAQGLTETTWVVYSSDHGEELGDHNSYYYHGASIYDTVLRVPLIVRGPGVEPGFRTGALVQNVDLAPTLLEIAGARAPREMEGVSLLDLLAEPNGAAREIAVAEWQDLIYSISDGRAKYIFNPKGACPLKPPWRAGAGPDAARGFVYDFEEYYDLEGDPLEQTNLAADRGPQIQAMRRELERWLAVPARRQGFDAGTLAPEEIELLEKLGYTAPGADRRDVRFRKDR
jgi:arylsulfatase A-like enzyme